MNLNHPRPTYAQNITYRVRLNAMTPLLLQVRQSDTPQPSTGKLNDWIESGAADYDPDDPDNVDLDPDAADAIDDDYDSDVSVSPPLYNTADLDDDLYLDNDINILSDRATSESPLQNATSPIQSARRSPILDEPLLNDIKIEYHPSSGRSASISSFEDYDRERQPRPISPEQHPWKPFRSRLDFEIAEVALEAALNRSQLDKLVKLFHRAAKRDETDLFTIQTAGEMKRMWELASTLRTPVRNILHNSFVL